MFDRIEVRVGNDIGASMSGSSILVGRSLTTVSPVAKPCLTVAVTLPIEKLMNRALQYLCVATLLAACADGSGGGGTSAVGSNASSSPGTPGLPSTISCTANYKYSAPLGQLHNNVWNSTAAGSFAWRQCLVQRQVGSSTQYGWTWVWPDPGVTVYAYPEIGVGKSAYWGGPQGDSRFPVQISAVDRMIVSYDVETVATGSRNLAAEMWITSTKITQPDPSAIATEFMIWSETVPAKRTPSGSKRADVTIDDVAWEVWVAEDFGAGIADHRWTYVAYRAKTSTPTITYDVRKLLGDAINRGYVNGGHYISDFQFGNEIMAGSGTTWIKRFSVTIN